MMDMLLQGILKYSRTPGSVEVAIYGGVSTIQGGVSVIHGGISTLYGGISTIYGGISTTYARGKHHIWRISTILERFAPYMDYHTYLFSLPIQLNIAAPQAAIGEVHIGEGPCTSHGAAMVTGGAGGTIGIGPLGT